MHLSLLSSCRCLRKIRWRSPNLCHGHRQGGYEVEPKAEMGALLSPVCLPGFNHTIYKPTIKYKPTKRKEERPDNRREWKETPRGLSPVGTAASAVGEHEDNGRRTTSFSALGCECSCSRRSPRTTGGTKRTRPNHHCLLCHHWIYQDMLPPRSPFPP